MVAAPASVLLQSTSWLVQRAEIEFPDFLIFKTTNTSSGAPMDYHCSLEMRKRDLSMQLRYVLVQFLHVLAPCWLSLRRCVRSMHE